MGIRSSFIATGTTPILDVGIVDAVRNGRVEVVAAVEGFDGADVLLADGSRIRPDAVIAATGFRAGLDELVGHLDVLTPRGLPVKTDGEPSSPASGSSASRRRSAGSCARAASPPARWPSDVAATRSNRDGQIRTVGLCVPNAAL